MEPDDRMPLGYLLTKLARVTAVRFAHALRQLDLHPRHYAALVALTTNPSSNQLGLARALDIAPSAVVVLLDDLERRGALTRARDPHNRRQTIASLTPTGHDLLHEGTRLGADLDNQLWAHLAPTARAALHDSLQLTYSTLDTPDFLAAPA